MKHYMMGAGDISHPGINVKIEGMTIFLLLTNNGLTAPSLRTIRGKRYMFKSVAGAASAVGVKLKAKPSARRAHDMRERGEATIDRSKPRADRAGSSRGHGPPHTGGCRHITHPVTPVTRKGYQSIDLDE